MALPSLPRCGRLARSTHSTLRTWAPQRASNGSCYTKAHGGAATKTMACQLTEILSTAPKVYNTQEVQILLIQL